MNELEKLISNGGVWGKTKEGAICKIEKDEDGQIHISRELGESEDLKELLNIDEAKAYDHYIYAPDMVKITGTQENIKAHCKIKGRLGGFGHYYPANGNRSGRTKSSDEYMNKFVEELKNVNTDTVVEIIEEL